MLRFQGIVASGGIAIGPAHRYVRTLLSAEDEELAFGEVGSEIERFDAAVSKARQEIEKVRRVAEQKVGASASSIFEAQMMMVSDEFILSTIRQRIKHELKPAAFVVDMEFSSHKAMLEMADNPLIRERADDIEDIKQRLLRYLLDRGRLRAFIRSHDAAHDHNGARKRLRASGSRNEYGGNSGKSSDARYFRECNVHFNN